MPIFLIDSEIKKNCETERYPIGSMSAMRKEISQLETKLDRAEASKADLLERLEKTTKYLEIRTKKQSKYSIPRLVDKVIEANRAAIAKAKKEG